VGGGGDPISIYEKPGMVVHIYHPSYVGGRGRRMAVQASLGKNERTYLKNNKSGENWSGSSKW
jgi:hypothetical protein